MNVVHLTTAGGVAVTRAELDLAREPSAVRVVLAHMRTESRPLAARTSRPARSRGGACDCSLLWDHGCSPRCPPCPVVFHGAGGTVMAGGSLWPQAGPALVVHRGSGGLAAGEHQRQHHDHEHGAGDPSPRRSEPIRCSISIGRSISNRRSKSVCRSKSRGSVMTHSPCLMCVNG